MSEPSPRRGTRLQIIWVMLGAFMLSAIGLTLIPALLIRPDPVDGPNEWLLVAILAGAAAIALAALQSRWFSKEPRDVGTATVAAVLLRVAVAEIVWLATFVFYLIGLVGVPVLLASLVIAAVLVLIFAAPTERLLDMMQDQLTATGSLGSVRDALGEPLPR